MTERAPSTGSMLVTGVIAGVLGGFLLDGYLLCVALATAHDAHLVGFYQFDASAVIGKVAFTDPNYAWLGVAVHYVVSVAWALGYVYAAKKTPQIRARPFVSGIAYGIVVYVAMLIAQVAAAVFTPPNQAMLVNGLIAYALFFGLPVAYVTRARLLA